MSARNKRGICVYCGKEKKLTVDHVPPKLLFTQPYPPNLLTVPACRDCNSSFIKDDEYTRVVATISVKALNSPEAQANLPVVLRALERPEAKAFADYLSRNVRNSPILDWTGKPVRIQQVDRRRVNATGSHIMRGLWSLETRRAVPVGAEIMVQMISGIDPEDPMIESFVQMYDLCTERRERALGKTFSCVAGFRESRSVWLMLLYGYFAWVGTLDTDPASWKTDEDVEQAA